MCKRASVESRSVPVAMAAEIAVAFKNGDLERVKELVEQQGLNPNVWKDAEYGKTPLHWASQYGRLEVMKYLVKKRKCNPMCKDVKWKNTPLHWAARFASLEAVKYLVDDCKCNVKSKNKQKNTPLHDAALGGNLEVVRFLIKERKCDPGASGRWGRTPLHYACEVSSIGVVKFLLEESGYDKPSCKDDTGLTPLHVAASQGSLGIVKYLIEERDCKMECKDDHNETPLHEAIKGGRFDIMKYLIKKGCDPQCGGKSGGTALHHACQHGRIEEVKYLIAKDNHAIDSPCDNSGASPLHVAAVNGRLDVVKLLVETFLCKLDVQDSNGQTPLECAQDKHEEEIVSYLLDLDENSGNLRSTLLKQLRPKTKQVIPTGTVLGSGAYGSVIELRCEGKTVAGKIFRTMSTAHTTAVQKKIKDELNIMMEIDHPNIVQTMGVCFLSDQPLPVLLMERMEYNLHSYLLDPNHISCPMETKLSILCDIANGLACLHNHTPPIIHRDLTANNVLLDSKATAKIADFGNSQISRTIMILGTLTSYPQSLEYIPKEDCSPSLDIFQFGDLALFTTIQTPIQPLLAPTYTDEKNPKVLCARSEVERRQQFVEKAEEMLSSNHSPLELIKQCLHNNPEKRPHTGKLLTTLQEMATPGGKLCPSQATPSSTPADNDSHDQESAMELSAVAGILGKRRHEFMEESRIGMKRMKSDGTEMPTIEKRVTNNAKTELMNEEKMILQIPRTVVSGGSDVQLDKDDEQGNVFSETRHEEVELRIKSLEVENEKLRKQLYQSKPKSSYNSLLGAEVVSEETLVVTNEGVKFHWKDHGFKMYIPKNALPEGISEYLVNIKVSLAGQFELPEGYELVSAVYWVAIPGEFTKPVTIEAQHCGNFSNLSQLCFVCTSCAQKSLPYKFKVNDGGLFTPGNKYGTLSTKHFSGTGIAKKVTLGEHSCLYCSQVYFTVKNLQDNWYYCHFVITKDLEMCLMVAKRKYQQEYDIAPPVTFGADHIALDIPDDGTKTDNGWEIVPVHKAHIKKHRVDNFSSENTWVPECVLLLKWLQKDKAPQPLEYKVKLNGTGEKNDFFRIVHNPESQLGISASTPQMIYPAAGGSSAEEPQLELTVGDHLEVTNYLLDLGKTDIHNLGLTLGLLHGHLKAMGDSQTFRDDMIDAWLKKEDQVTKRGKPTWDTLVKALKDPRVNQAGVANKVEEEKINRTK